MSAAPHLKLVQSLVDTSTGELQGCPHCNEARDEAETWEKEVLKLKRELERARIDRDERTRHDKDYPAAHDLFDEWARETGHPNARFDTNRANLAIRAIRGYRQNRAALSMVIQYGKHFAYTDEKGVRHDSFGLLFRDAEHIEKYANTFARRRREVTS